MGSNPISSIVGCRIIAEAGTSHNGQLSLGRELIDAAAESGADCVKFQAVLADEILHPLTGDVELPTGRVALYETFRRLEREPSFYAGLKEHAGRRKIEFLCTPFGLGSAAMLEGLGVTAWKIASPELNHYPLIRWVAARGKPIYLSSGVSKLADIERALEIVGDLAILLHCVTSYPAPEEDYNLRVVPNLRALLGVPVGVSDHSRDPVLVPALAAALGAVALEKHLTLSNTTDGLDDPIALEPSAFRRMVDEVRVAERSGLEATRARMAATHGAARVEGVLGTGIKRLAPSEIANYGRTNRSLHARGAIPRGKTITAEDVVIVRTEKVLRPGLGPEHMDGVVGRRASRDIPAGEGITWEDL